MTLPNAGKGVDEDTVADQVEVQAKYYGYVERQRDEVQRRAQQEDQVLPPDLDYSVVRGLSKEAQQTLQRHRPETLGQATRISGVTPAAIALLLVHLKRAAAPRKKSA
jgi:tRNA uridine 5-carboxymethylaminomethyl modification enzyme